MKRTFKDLKIKIIGGQIINRVLPNVNDAVESRGTIVAKTISSGYINDEDIIVNQYKTNCDEKRITKLNDIVIKITPPFAAALVDNEHVGLLVSSFCMILNELPEDVLPEYLTAYLNSEAGVKQVTSSMSGSTISTISVASLKNISLPIPSLEEQKNIGEAFVRYIKNIKLTKKLVSLSREKFEALISEVK